MSDMLIAAGIIYIFYTIYMWDNINYFIFDIYSLHTYIPTLYIYTLYRPPIRKDCSMTLYRLVINVGSSQFLNGLDLNG